MKMNRILITITIFGALAILAHLALAHGNEPGSAKAAVGNTKVSIDFRRPMLKGRDLMKLLHPGDLWRMGADVPTTIDSDSDLDFGGTRVAKGKHILLARFVEAGKWTLVVSSKDRSHYEPGAKLAEIPMEVKEGKDAVDAMNIQLSNKNGSGEIEIDWGTFRLTATFSPAT